jgi:hypothetical protein
VPLPSSSSSKAMEMIGQSFVLLRDGDRKLHAAVYVRYAALFPMGGQCWSYTVVG